MTSAPLSLLLERTKVGEESFWGQLSLLPEDNYQSNSWDRWGPYNFKVHIHDQKHTLHFVKIE